MVAGKKSWIHKANRNRNIGSDIDRIITVMSYIGKGFKAAQYQVLQLKNGKYGQRRPDILLDMSGFDVPVELDGGIHGFNDELTETTKTKVRNDDYVRDGIIPIILNHEQLKELGISEEIYIKCAIILLEPIFRAKKRLR